MTWWMYAMGAALIWGVHYNLLSKAMTTISPLTAYWMPTTIMVLGLPFFYKTIQDDLSAVLSAPTSVKVSVAIISFTSFLASVSLYKAIQMHNPVHVGLLEITYPIFIAIFAYLLWHENHINVPTIIGGLMIMIGAGIVIYKG